MFVCVCHGISDKKIQQLIDEGKVTLPELQQALGVGTACGKCIRVVCQMLQAQQVPINFYSVK